MATTHAAQLRSTFTCVTVLPCVAAGHSRGAINATLYAGHHGDIPMVVLVAGRYDLTLNMTQRCTAVTAHGNASNAGSETRAAQLVANMLHNSSGIYQS